MDQKNREGGHKRGHKTFAYKESAKRIWDQDSLHKEKGLVVFAANVIVSVSKIVN